MNWEEFFQVAIQEEHKAEAKYGGAAAQTDDPKLKDIFEKLQYEESLHADLLESEYGRWRKQKAS
jgi:rubrerythrin